MVARSSSLSRPSSIAISAILAIAISLILDAATADTLRIWKIGSPHTGDTPRASTPYELSWEMARRKAKMSVEAFPARGFAARFRDAVARNNPPDVLVFDNHGVMDGITTDLAAAGQRFGPFRWRSSQSTEVVADIAEFTYHDDARLFFRFGGFPEAPNLVSEGHLWTTFSEWSWRVWSVTSDGNITFSEARTFTH